MPTLSVGYLLQAGPEPLNNGPSWVLSFCEYKFFLWTKKNKKCKTKKSFRI